MVFFTAISRKKRQTNIYFKKSVDGRNEKQFNTPRLQGKAKKTTSLSFYFNDLEISTLINLLSNVPR